MHRRRFGKYAALWSSTLLGSSLSAQTGTSASADEYRVFSDAPRILLRPQRLSRLRKEIARQTERFNQLQALVAGGAPMPEPGFAYGLYFQVTQEEQYAAKAQEFAAKSNDIRQLAMVCDWCPDSQKTLLPKIKALIPKTPVNSVRVARDRVFAAVALADFDPTLSAAILKEVVEQWWRPLAPRLALQPQLIARNDLMALYELLHVLRDNLNIDLRSDAIDYFKKLIQYQLLTYYPAPYPAVENEYRIPLMSGPPTQEPDLRLAANGRIAELAMVAYDNNATESQFLQGWLMNDKFILKATYGAAYEFLWANPYQPGLTYFLLPLFYHDPATGQLFFRSSWQEDAEWFGFTENRMQVFRGGEIKPLTLDQIKEPLRMGPMELRKATLPLEVRVADENLSTLFLMGLPPKTVVPVEIDDEELSELVADAGGTVKLELDPRVGLGVFVGR
jgi:hypothetical protein